MQVYKGAPNAEDLTDGQLVWVGIDKEWHLFARWSDNNTILNPITYRHCIKMSYVKKWAHCEAPIESAEE